MKRIQQPVRWIVGGLLVSSALLSLGAASAAGQSVESIMRARERLELTEEQVQRLDAIRRDAVAQRTAEMAEVAELRSQLEAGQIRRSELMALMENQQDARRARLEERRTSIDAVLTETQRDQVQEMRRRGDRSARGPRRDGFTPRGRGFGPGGDGFAPRGGRGFGPADAPPPPPPAD